MSKNTEEIVKQLSKSNSFKNFYDENKQYMITESLSEMLNDLLISKHLKKSDVVKRAEISDIYCYQIFSGVRVPNRNKLLCIAVALELNIEETQLLLKAAGYSQLYVKIPFDSIVLYGICNNLDVVEINDLLFEYDLETLG